MNKTLIAILALILIAYLIKRSQQPETVGALDTNKSIETFKDEKIQLLLPG
jgi:hypothetical protein